MHYQYSCIPEWTGGIYATPTLAGDIFILCNNTLVFGKNIQAAQFSNSLNNNFLLIALKYDLVWLSKSVLIFHSHLNLFLGSRCGMSIALAWATLLYFGRSRYLERTKAIITCARTIANAISGISNEVMIKFNFR